MMLYYSKLFEQQSFMLHINNSYQGLWEGGSADTSVRVPESQEGACKSLKGPNSLSQRFFVGAYFQLFLVYLEKKLPVVLLELKSSNFQRSLVSACPRGPKSVLFRLAKFPLEALTVTLPQTLSINYFYLQKCIYDETKSYFMICTFLGIYKLCTLTTWKGLAKGFLIMKYEKQLSFWDSNDRSTIHRECFANS